jgi:glucose-6-phosphate-specific signal transduction histidine kinase
MTNTEIIQTVLKEMPSQKSNIVSAMNWLAKESKATSRDEAIEALINKCVNDFDEVIKHASGSYVITDKTNPVECFKCLFGAGSAMSNYITATFC